MRAQRPRVGLSLMLEGDFRDAAIPLFEEGIVDAVEWSFDQAWAPPEWLSALLDHYAAADCLYGHGVELSMLNAQEDARQTEWLQRFTAECARRRYRHVSEHFGFMTAPGFARGAPLPVPRTDAALAAGRARLGELAELARVPVGMENLALAFGPRDVAEQGAFLRELIEPTGGFVVLDLHNLFCQAANFAVDPEALLASYPLERVREIHVSGGSWSHRGFRRDTHDGPIPAEVLALLRRALAACPDVEVVIVERLGGTLTGEAERDLFRSEFREVRRVVDEAPAGSAARAETALAIPAGATTALAIPAGAVTEAELAAYQAALLALLHGAASVDGAMAALATGEAFAPVRDYVATFDRRALEVGMELAKKWSVRAPR